MSLRELVSCCSVAKIFYAYQNCQAGNFLVTKLVKRLLTTNIEKLNFAFFHEPCLIFYILSLNNFPVNVYKILCCNFMILLYIPALAL